MANIPIGDNIIYMQRKGSTDPKDTVATVLFGPERIDVGVNSGNKEIAKDKESGFKYERDAIDSKTIYQLQNQKHKNFFILDLETGKRTKGGWYPGAIQAAKIKGQDIKVREAMSETSETLITLQDGIQVKILDLDMDSSKVIWYQISYDEIVGYVKSVETYGIIYVDPY